MITDAFNIPQILGIIVVAALTTGVVSLSIRLWASRGERGAKTDGIVSDGWRKYAEKLEKRMDALEKRYEEGLLLKDAKIRELEEKIDLQEEQIKKLRHRLANYEQAAQSAKEAADLTT